MQVVFFKYRIMFINFIKLFNNVDNNVSFFKKRPFVSGYIISKVGILTYVLTNLSYAITLFSRNMKAKKLQKIVCSMSF